LLHADEGYVVDFTADVDGVIAVAREAGVDGVLTVSADRAVPVVAAVAALSVRRVVSRPGST
jgi:hypothetical protein